jgi:two-component system nitrogen regulation response regulator GlnG
MQNTLLLTHDNSLEKELLLVLPKGHRLVSGTKIAASADGWPLVIIDIDSVDIGRVRDYAGKCFVLALTKQERTGPVMEAATYGAYEIMRLPLSKERIARFLAKLAALRRELTETITIDKDILAPAATCVIVGRSALVMSLCEKVARIAQVEVPVLITGETGTGKELVAEAIAQLSSRFGKPFVVINSAAMPEALLESELFGYERGAFTGAVAAKEGMLKTADGGCVFFDEVGELPLALQGKLLRFLQTQTFYPVGSTKEIQVNVRIISATNRNLETMVREGRFREDLYHRLRVAAVHAPPLRERRKDIMPLVQCLFYRHSHTAQKPIKGVTNAFMDRLLAYDWPGNIRELENTLRSAIALCKTDYLTTHELSDLGSQALTAVREDPVQTFAAAVSPFVKDLLNRKERGIYEKVHAALDQQLLGYVLSVAGENQSAAARLLGISRLTLRKKMEIS